MRAPLTGTPRKDGRWQAIVTLTRPDGAKIRKCLIRKTQREVQAAARELLANNPSRSAPNEYTVSQLLDYCAKGPWSKLAEATQEQYNGAARRRIEQEFGGVRVSDLTTPRIYQWCLELASQPRIGGRSVQIHRNILRVALQEAIFLGWIRSNPAAGWRLPKSIDTRPRKRQRMTPEQVERIIADEPVHSHRMFLRTLWETGGRPSEVCALTSDCLVKADDLGWWLDLPGTKTEAAARMIPVSQELASDLLDLPEPWFRYSRRQWTELWHRVQVRMGWRERGTRLARGKAVADAPTLYGIRKVRITVWKEIGVEDEVWIALAGHENVDLTRETYDKPTLKRMYRQVSMSNSMSMESDGQVVTADLSSK